MYRPTSFGLALATAAMKLPVNRADESNWIQRRVVMNLERPKLGVVQEKEHVHLKFATAKKLQASGVIK